MAYFSKQIGLEGQAEDDMGSSSSAHIEWLKQGRSDHLVLDMENISLISNATATSNNTSNASEWSELGPPESLVPLALKLQKSLSRKASLRAERKMAASTSHGGDDDDNLHISRGIQPPPTHHHPGHSKPLIAVTSPITDGSAGTLDTSLPRRKRAPSHPWLGPRRVLFLFATLSSMGTLVLLYFTLSLARTNGGDRNAE